MIRPYEPKDLKQSLRIFREIGWMDGKDSDKDIFEAFTDGGNSLVAELNGEVEVFVVTRSGACKYLDDDIPFSAVASVATSRVARQRGLASKVTAQAIAESAANGAAMSMLGMFDQGYYEKFGFGNTVPCRISTFDPVNLRVPRLTRSPKRLSKDDAKAMHDCRRLRKRFHGGCNLDGYGETKATTIWQEHGFGLGFENDEGVLTHFMWIKPKGEHGPYSVWFTGWETHEQFIELLSVLKSLSDQVHGIRMADPPRFQLQDFLDRPHATFRSRKGGDFDSDVLSQVWMQCRILDLPVCIGAMKFCGKPISFNLELTDPIEKYLPKESNWRGIGGGWIIRLGEESSATQGRDDSLPTASCTVNDLSRIWFGSSTAESVALTGHFRADPELIQAIDKLVCVPIPAVDWDF
ncbi:MAG: GNAT family N-acetyltransferase [Phycisphaerae bacterium]|nr:GNAT family N-acetyltransferase [Phycisphaerae bacterium]